MSYTDYQTSEYARQIEEAHNTVLEAFKVGLLTNKLIERLEELSTVKSKKIYSWIVNSIPKNDSLGNLKEIYIGDDSEEIERTGFTEYFKDQQEYLDNLTPDEELI